MGGDKKVIVNDNVSICKTEFKIMPNESTKSSGNRCIVAKDTLKQGIKILLNLKYQAVTNAEQSLGSVEDIRSIFFALQECLYVKAVR